MRTVTYPISCILLCALLGSCTTSSGPDRVVPGKKQVTIAVPPRPKKPVAPPVVAPPKTQIAEPIKEKVPRTYLELGPLIGHVTPTEAKIWAKASGETKLAVRIGLKSDLSDARDSAGILVASNTLFSGHMLVRQLEPRQRYYYSVTIDGEPAMPRPYPSFLTAPNPGEKGHQRIAFVSCVGYNGYDSAPTWAEMATRTNFDVLLMLGDNHYGNTTDTRKHFEMFGVQRRLPGYAEIAKRVPEYAIWDNHDYSPEPCDKTAKNKEETLHAFTLLWPNPAYGEPDNPGVYHKFSRGDVDFFMLDDRYHRDPNDSPEDGKKSYLGARQFEWLKKELLASRATIKMVAAGGEFQTDGIKASWSSFRREQGEFFKFLQDNNITGVLLLSGDRHFTAGYQVRGKWIEVTSGPTGSQFGESKPTSEMFYYASKGKFFCIYDIDTRKEVPAVTLEVYKTGEGLIQRKAFTWDQVLGKAKIAKLSAVAAPREKAKQ